MHEKHITFLLKESSYPAITSTSTLSGPQGLSVEKGMLSAEELMKVCVCCMFLFNFVIFGVFMQTADLANANATEEAKVKAMMSQSDLYSTSQ